MLLTTEEDLEMMRAFGEPDEELALFLKSLSCALK